jgi:hypothetical protein
MANNSITPNNIHGWLAALGYIFPRTEGELLRFEKFTAEMVIPEDELIDPEVLLGRKQRTKVRKSSGETNPGNPIFKMAARNGLSNIPDHILDKMKKNQENKKKDDAGNPEETAE